MEKAGALVLKKVVKNIFGAPPPPSTTPAPPTPWPSMPIQGVVIFIGACLSLGIVLFVGMAVLLGGGLGGGCLKAVYMVCLKGTGCSKLVRRWKRKVKKLEEDDTMSDEESDDENNDLESSRKKTEQDIDAMRVKIREDKATQESFMESTFG